MVEKSVYNIGAIARLTGIPIATLHAWERRYGFPKAARSAGGHRLYSDYDMLLLRAVKGQIEQGLAARHAVAAVQQMAEAGTLSSGHPFETPQAGTPGKVPFALRDQMIASLLHPDLEQADRLLGDMMAFYSPEELTLQVIGPALNEIGEAWEQGRINIATEHLASNYLRHHMLMWMGTALRPHAINPIILACSPNEWHEGGLLMLGVLLRRLGWPVAYFGQNTPFPDLAAYIQKIQPSAVVLVAMIEESAHSLADWPKWITQSAGKPYLTYGGRVFTLQPHLQNEVPGIYLGNTIQEGLQKLIDLLEDRK
jgi:MerR family transcriptional regulator, light-induced transcriptional regulator